MSSSQKLMDILWEIAESEVDIPMEGEIADQQANLNKILTKAGYANVCTIVANKCSREHAKLHIQEVLDNLTQQVLEGFSIELKELVNQSASRM